MDDNFEKIQFKSFWKPESKDEYVGAFSDADIVKSYINITSVKPVGKHTTQEEVDQLTDELSNVYLNPAKQVGLCKKATKATKAPTNKVQKTPVV